MSLKGKKRALPDNGLANCKKKKKLDANHQESDEDKEEVLVEAKPKPPAKPKKVKIKIKPGNGLANCEKKKKLDTNEEEDDEDEKEGLQQTKPKPPAKPVQQAKKTKKVKKKVEPVKKKNEPVKKKNEPQPQPQLQPQPQPDSFLAELQSAIKLGLRITDLKTGEGNEAVCGNIVGVYYDGRLQKDNTIIEQHQTGDPCEFQLGAEKVIKGWDLGIVGMKKGGKRRLEIPARLAYGEDGCVGVPPKSKLLYEIELKTIDYRAPTDPGIP